MGTITEYFDYINRKELSKKDLANYSHIDVNNKDIQAARKLNNKDNKAKKKLTTSDEEAVR